MPIQYRCSQCRRMLSVSSRLANQMAACPRCQAVTMVPAGEAIPAALPPEIVEAPPVKPPLVRAEPLVFVKEPPAITRTPPAIEVVAAGRGVAAAQPSPPQVAVGEEETDDDRVDHNDTPRMSLRKPETPFDEMDLTPMVDVVFQLLIFFMVTASFSVQKSIRVPVPDPHQKGASQAVQTLEELQSVSMILRIDGANAMALDDQPIPDDAELDEVFREKLRADRKSELIVQADALARHRIVVRVVDAANEAGVSKIRLATQTAVVER